MSAVQLLPVVLLGIDTPIGLTIIRDLGMRGVQVHGIASSSDAIGLSSRYLHRGYTRHRGEELLIKQLADIGADLGAACLFAVSESDISLLNRHRDRLHSYRMIFANEAQINRVLNKELTYTAARKVGIYVPRTIQVLSLPEASSACKSVRYPVVLKWSNPNNVIRLLSNAGLRLDKAHYCYSADELLSYLAPYEKVGVYPLIQEYCPGHGLGQFILMRDGHAHYVFQHRRVHEWPPEGGVSSLCESVSLEHHQDLMEKSIALLRELQWEGIAMVEYRHDPKTGNSALMEINGRFWGSLPLACHAGASFPWLSYQLLGMNQPIENRSYRSGVRCRFMIPETKRLLRLFFGQKKISDRHVTFKRVPELIRYLVDFISPRTYYYVFDWRDPSPFFRDMLQIIRRPIRRLLTSK